MKKPSSGELGEKIVGQWLESQGYVIRNYRWRCRWGEIDIIAEDRTNNTLVFVEVKTRQYSSNNWDEGGLTAVSLAKQKKIYQTAQLFLAQYPELADFYCRFDVALVAYKQDKDKVKLIIKDYLKNAFEAVE